MAKDRKLQNVNLSYNQIMDHEQSTVASLLEEDEDERGKPTKTIG